MFIPENKIFAFNKTFIVLCLNLRLQYLCMVICNRWPINEKDFLKKYLTCTFFLYYKMNSNFLFFTQNTFFDIFPDYIREKML